MSQVSLRHRGPETSLRRMERRVVDVQEGVESHTAGRVSPQVQRNTASCSQSLLVSADAALCVSGIICTTWYSKTGKLLRHCKEEKGAKSKLLSHSVCLLHTQKSIYPSFREGSCHKRLFCMIISSTADRQQMRLVLERWKVFTETRRINNRMLESTLEHSRRATLQ